MTSSVVTQADTLSSTALLRALVTECVEVATDCRSLEVVVAEIVSSFPQGHLINRLQAMDLIIQRIEAMACVLRATADHAPLTLLPAQQILGEVLLSNLVSKFSGQAPPRLRTAPGDVEVW